MKSISALIFLQRRRNIRPQSKGRLLTICVVGKITNSLQGRGLGCQVGYEVEAKAVGLLLLSPLPSQTDSISILLRHQTRSAFVQNYMRLLRRFTHSSITTKDSNTNTKYVPFLKRSLVSRSLYSSSVDHSNCDFDSPCACSECMQDQRKPICEICRVRPTVHQSYEDSRNRKDIRFYSFTSFCEQCWQEHETVHREREEKEKQILASYKARVASMLNNVQQIRLAKQVPIVCAVDKFIN